MRNNKKTIWQLQATILVAVMLDVGLVDKLHFKPTHVIAPDLSQTSLLHGDLTHFTL